MRRLILMALVAVLCYFGYVCITEGVRNENFNIDISKFEQVEIDSDDMTKELAAYNEKNDKQFEVVKTNLTHAIKNYENTKQEYQDLIETLGIQEDTEVDEVLVATEKAYQIDFLLATIGNYATKEGIKDLDLVFVESVTSRAPSDAGYVYADLKFTVEADYILIANFLYDLEDDDRLAYEIRDYNMVRDKATFTVYNVPIESSTLSSMTSANSTGSGTNNSKPNETNSSTSSNNKVTNTTATQGTTSGSTNTVN